MWAKEGASNRGLEEIAKWGAAWFVFLTKYYLGDKKTEIGEDHGMYGGEMKYIQDISEQTSREETTGKIYT